MKHLSRRMFKISLFIKYTTLLLIVISGQVYIFTTQEPQIFNETSEFHEQEEVKRVKICHMHVPLAYNFKNIKLSKKDPN